MNTAPDAIKTAAAEVGGQAALARHLGVTPPTVNQWVKGERPVPIEHCPAIADLSHGKATRQQLRPDDWHRIWPELITTAPDGGGA